MIRGGYKSSVETKRRIIASAGELFARNSVSTVSLREIAAHAGVALNAICYHFGGKDELVAAVWDFALRRWDDRRLERYCEEHSDLFESRAGQRRLVVDTIDLFYTQLFENSQPSWINIFLHRSLITAQCPERASQVFGMRLIDVFCDIYRKITSNEDPRDSFCWCLNIVGPASFFAASATDYNTFQPVETVDGSLLRRIQETVTRNALSSLGLEDKEAPSYL